MHHLTHRIFYLYIVKSKMCLPLQMAYDWIFIFWKDDAFTWLQDQICRDKYTQRGLAPIPIFLTQSYCLVLVLFLANFKTIIYWSFWICPEYCILKRVLFFPSKFSTWQWLIEKKNCWPLNIYFEYIHLVELIFFQLIVLDF